MVFPDAQLWAQNFVYDCDAAPKTEHDLIKAADQFCDRPALLVQYALVMAGRNVDPQSVRDSVTPIITTLLRGLPFQDVVALTEFFQSSTSRTPRHYFSARKLLTTDESALLPSCKRVACIVSAYWRKKVADRYAPHLEGTAVYKAQIARINAQRVNLVQQLCDPDSGDGLMSSAMAKAKQVVSARYPTTEKAAKFCEKLDTLNTKDKAMAIASALLPYPELHDERGKFMGMLREVLTEAQRRANPQAQLHSHAHQGWRVSSTTVRRRHAAGRGRERR